MVNIPRAATKYIFIFSLQIIYFSKFILVGGGGLLMNNVTITMLIGASNRAHIDETVIPIYLLRAIYYLDFGFGLIAQI